MIVASPANPTGTVILRDAFTALAAFCEHNGIRLISDEIYHGITYGMRAVSAAGLSEHAIIINSFSKYFSMTGWRLGWMVVPEGFTRPLECLAQNMFISAPTISQHAALAVFDCIDALEANVARYARNREILLARLPEIGFTRFAPADGAFYIYADVSALTGDAQGFLHAPCSMKPASPPPPGSISIPSTATALCVSHSPARPPTWKRPVPGSPPGAAAVSVPNKNAASDGLAAGRAISMGFVRLVATSRRA